VILVIIFSHLQEHKKIKNNILQSLILQNAKKNIAEKNLNKEISLHVKTKISLLEVQIRDENIYWNFFIEREVFASKRKCLNLYVLSKLHR